MDDAHLYEALRYVLLNPVRAGLVGAASAWRWSSAGAYLRRVDDGLTDSWRMLARITDMVAYLDEQPDAERLKRLRTAESIGRPAVSADAMRRIEVQTGRRLRAGRSGKRQQLGS